MRERERERERETDRQTDRQTDREWKRGRDRQTDRVTGGGGETVCCFSISSILFVTATKIDKFTKNLNYNGKFKTDGFKQLSQCFNIVNHIKV